MSVEYVVFTSCGNDSVALLQWCIDAGLNNVHAVYTDTLWGSDEWPARVDEVKKFCSANGIEFHHIITEGFASMCKAKRNQAFPRDGMQFCTEELKVIPSMSWLDDNDPEKEATCLVGVRREESAKRRNWPLWVEESEKHGGRSLHSPLITMTEKERNSLIDKTGLSVLPHRSRECWPCVNSGKMDLRQLSQSDVDKVKILEEEMGVGKRSGKPKYMFRSAKTGGAKGIVEVVKWASHTKYVEGMDDLFGGGCDSGFCGD